ncbi:Universal stress protein family [Pseudonocardia sp. Ae168_Ps1]|nr:Universal stress protein family [Pseudonocardia sp. Ae150A_Ps1]OLL82929.1 Universal stress protein family [Pseudonocardia sp. Ae168_Ps1]OLL82962.1 Universal stress protein family [Pseudonocardia sp. Ae263_Ps1]OLL91000.1 Universal stress protein family [Pseudonocardia sp. Ae356_Ps1]
MVMSDQQGRPVVVGIDGSASARDAVRWAAAEAVARRVRLRLVAVYTPLPPGHRHDMGLGPAYRAQVVGTLQEALTGAAALVSGIDVDLESEIRAGYPADVLTEESRGASLTVVGSRGLGGFSGLLVGSVAVAVAAHGGSPVLVVRGERAPDAGLPVVLGVDGSPAGEAAVGPAFEQASRRSVPLRAVHAWSDVVLDPAVAVLIDAAALEAEEREVLAERLAGWSEKYPDVDVQRIVVRDRPAHALIAESAGAGLVVVGSRGRGGLAGLLLGSVGQALLRHADCPVLVARP